MLLSMAPVVAQVGALDSPYGLCVHAPYGSAQQAKVDTMMDAGVDWIRIDFLWQWVEPGQDAFNWSVYDSIANYVRSRSRPLHVLANLQAPPPWAVQPGQNGMLISTADLTDVLTRAVERYRGVIDYWGLYNEPDFTSNWTGTRGQYIDQIIKPGADAIHAASSSARVVGPELSHLGSHQWYYWLKDTLEQAGDRIDVVSHHAYGDDRATHNNRLNASTLAGSSPNWWGLVNPSLREVLEYTGWDGPVWLTETGWTSDKAGGQPWQARRLNEFLEDWFGNDPNEGNWIDKVFFYEMSDDPSASPFGLLESNGDPKLAYRALGDFIASQIPEVPCVGPACAALDTFETGSLSLVAGEAPGASAQVVGQTALTSAYLPNGRRLVELHLDAGDEIHATLSPDTSEWTNDALTITIHRHSTGRATVSYAGDALADLAVDGRSVFEVTLTSAPASGTLLAYAEGARAWDYAQLPLQGPGTYAFAFSDLDELSSDPDFSQLSILGFGIRGQAFDTPLTYRISDIRVVAPGPGQSVLLPEPATLAFLGIGGLLLTRTSAVRHEEGTRP